ncbi:MAG: hypothetical protein K2Z25_01890 [Beijerinckiaceae bacterium]|nr:hypothetical protein [Beijerinckiaceae bacterium]
MAANYFMRLVNAEEIILLHACAARIATIADFSPSQNTLEPRRRARDRRADPIVAGCP